MSDCLAYAYTRGIVFVAGCIFGGYKARVRPSGTKYGLWGASMA